MSTRALLLNSLLAGCRFCLDFVYSDLFKQVDNVCQCVYVCVCACVSGGAASLY